MTWAIVFGLYAFGESWTAAAMSGKLKHKDVPDTLMAVIAGVVWPLFWLFWWLMQGEQKV